MCARDYLLCGCSRLWLSGDWNFEDDDGVAEWHFGNPSAVGFTAVCSVAFGECSDLHLVGDTLVGDGLE